MSWKRGGPAAPAGGRGAGALDGAVRSLITLTWSIWLWWP